MYKTEERERKREREGGGDLKSMFVSDKSKKKYTAFLMHRQWRKNKTHKTCINLNFTINGFVDHLP